MLTIDDMIVIWDHTDASEIRHYDDLLATKVFATKMKKLKSLIKSLFRPNNLLFFCRNTEQLQNVFIFSCLFCDNYLRLEEIYIKEIK